MFDHSLLNAKHGEIKSLIDSGAISQAEVVRIYDEIINSVPQTVTLTEIHRYMLSDDMIEPAEQLETIKALNRFRGWGIAEDDFPATVPSFDDCRRGVPILAFYFEPKPWPARWRDNYNHHWTVLRSVCSSHSVRHDRVISASEGDVYDYGHRLFRPGVRWLEFNPLTYRHKSAAEVHRPGTTDATPAISESFLAAAFYPAWIRSWNQASSPAPMLPWLMFTQGPDRHRVPIMNRYNHDKSLRLNLISASHRDVLGFASPTVYEL